MNEKGLVANLLYLAESQYPKPNKSDKRLPLGVAMWAQYVLDNFATVKEALNNLEKENFYIVPVNTPDGEPGTVHLAISDSLGDSAILEYLNGKLVIHSNRQYQVMTNSPSFDQQLAISSYWQKIGGMNMLPGTNSAADRFTRASYYIQIAPKSADINTALASVFSIIRNTSTPMGVSDPKKPNIAPTRWRTVSDQKNQRYYFESSTSPNIFWVDLADIKFDAGESVKKLNLGKNIIYSSNVAEKFQKSESLKFLQSP
jgi:choloylglycine hydrolase